MAISVKLGGAGHDPEVLLSRHTATQCLRIAGLSALSLPVICRLGAH